jgi:hypothetical protein
MRRELRITAYAVNVETRTVERMASDLLNEYRSLFNLAGASGGSAEKEAITQVKEIADTAVEFRDVGEKCERYFSGNVDKSFSPDDLSDHLRSSIPYGDNECNARETAARNRNSLYQSARIPRERFLDQIMCVPKSAS